jgi:DNA-binding NarL/FixJ family response regulator
MMNVFVLDAHGIYRRGVVASLAELPDVRSVAEAGSVDEARRHPALAGADVLIVDHDAPGAHELMRELSATGGVHAIVCTARCGENDVVAAMRSGAVGVLAKATLTPESLIGAVRAGARGAGVLAPELLGHLLDGAHGNGGPPVHALTPRERRVLSLIADGRQTREVARELSYSERTVKNVLHDAATKLHARSRSQAVAYAVRSGLI